jgi:hypothetical protein
MGSRQLVRSIIEYPPVICQHILQSDIAVPTIKVVERASLVHSRRIKGDCQSVHYNDCFRSYLFEDTFCDIHLCPAKLVEYSILQEY